MSNPRRLPLAAQILIGMALGAIVGLLLPAAGRNEAVDNAVEFAGIGGQLWLRALQMTVLPLVFGLLATLFVRGPRMDSVAGGGRMTRRAFATIAALYALAVPVAVASVYGLLAAFPVTDAMARALRAMAGEGVTAEAVPWAEAVLSVIPENIAAAMSGPSLLPVLFFALVFGAALARLPDGAGRTTLTALLTGMTDTMFVIVDWVLRIAPLGVALLVLPTVHQFGTDVFAALAHWIGISIAQLLILLTVLYAVVVVATRVPVGRFAREMLPVQMVAMGTQSSTGCMPLTIAACRRMGLSRQAIDATVPLAAVVFRMSAVGTAVLVSLYAAQVYGLGPLPVLVVAGIGALGGLLEVGSVGIPSAATYLARVVPIAAIVGFPIEFIVVLLVVETIPDILKTTNHVTAHALAAAIVDRNAPPFADEVGAA